MEFGEQHQEHGVELVECVELVETAGAGEFIGLGSTEHPAEPVGHLHQEKRPKDPGAFRVSWASELCVRAPS